MNESLPNKYLVCVSHLEVAKVAIRIACAKAKKNGDTVELFHVIEPADFQSLFAVADKLREERRAEAEALLNDLCIYAQSLGITPVINLREGIRGEEIVKATLEDADISLLIIGVQAESSNNSKLAEWLVTQMGNKLLVPMLLVPNGLTDLQIEELI